MLSNHDEQNHTQAVVIPAPGASFGRYRIDAKLGAGGMGDVYAAQDEQLNRRVALKFLSPALAADTVFRERFFREARAAAGLNHPNIVTVFEVAEESGWVFLAMEHVDGQSLKEMVAGGPLPPGQVVEIGSQICDGLSAAHGAKLIHRDIKSHNIMVDTCGRVRLLDFGLAKADDDNQLTQAGMAVGTANYMSPEQGQGLEVDHRSDLFSLGIVLYETLTGKLPFAGESLPATLQAVISKQPAQVRSLRPNLPIHWQTFLDRALAKDPTQRYESARAMRDDLLTLAPQPAVPVNTSVTIPAAARSLAVLHLRNLSAAEDEFLCYGITEDLIVDMTRLGSVRVASMRSVLKYKDSDEELQELAARLKADLVLDGSIMRAGERIRVSVQLVDVVSGDNLWAQRWEESTDDLPRVKNELVDGLARALQLDTSEVRRAEIGAPEADDAEAYQNYLKAKYTFHRKQERTDIDIALGLYALALKQEPTLLAARAGLAEIMMHNGDMASAKIELESALTDAEASGRQSDKAELLRLLARVSAKQSEWTEAQERAEAALEIAEEMEDPAGQAAALGILISVLQPQAKIDEAIKHFDRVLKIGRQLDDQEEMGDALKAMGVAYSRMGEFDRALDLYEDALELARRFENTSLEASCLANVGNVHFFRGQLDKALCNYQQAHGMADRIGDSALAARQSLNMGLIHLMGGGFREGLKLLEEAAATFLRLGDKSTYALTLTNISQARISLGDLDAAVEAADHALVTARNVNAPIVAVDATAQLAWARFAGGDYEEAVGLFEEALLKAESSSLTRNQAHIHADIMYAHLRFGRPRAARSHARQALSLAREIGEKPSMLLAKAGLGVIDAAQGLFNSGLSQIQAAVRDGEKLGHYSLSMTLRLLLAEVLFAHGESDDDRQEGRQLLLKLRTEAEDRGLKLEVKRVTELLGDEQSQAKPIDTTREIPLPQYDRNQPAANQSRNHQP